MANSRVANRLSMIRQSRGISAAGLARRVSTSRQTIYAIESGAYVPNTELALHLARELEVPVESIFSLSASTGAPLESVPAEILGEAAAGQPVRVGQVEGRWIAVPATAVPTYIPEADAIVTRAGAPADLAVFSRDVFSSDSARDRLVLAGCDPAAGLLASLVERLGGVEVISAPASSRLALKWLKEGKIHIAGSHLEDTATGEFNVPQVRKAFPDEEMNVVTFARWEEGFVVASGNPKSIRKPEDLARRGIRFVNRESGSGIRSLVDRLLDRAGVAASKVRGYERVARGHLEAAYRVLAGDSDVCLATRSAAQTFGLGFVPLHAARYDFVFRKRDAAAPAVKSFLDVLQRAVLRRKLEGLAGYDTSQTGVLIV